MYLKKAKKWLNIKANIVVFIFSKQRAVAVKNFESLFGVVSNNPAKMMKVLGLLLLSFVVV